DQCAGRLAHLLPADLKESMDMDLRRQTVAGGFQHPWPEQRVKVGDILADEVMHLALRRLPPISQLLTVGLTPLQRAGDVADRRVEPDIPIVAGRISDLGAKIR